MLLIIFIGLFLGLSYIALGMKKHQATIVSPKVLAKSNRLAFVLGTGLLMICLIYTLYTAGVGIGLVYYLGVFTLMHLLVILFVHYAPKRLAYMTGFYFLLVK